MLHAWLSIITVTFHHTSWHFFNKFFYLRRLIWHCPVFSFSVIPTVFYQHCIGIHCVYKWGCCWYCARYHHPLRPHPLLSIVCNRFDKEADPVLFHAGPATFRLLSPMVFEHGEEQNHQSSRRIWLAPTIRPQINQTCLPFSFYSFFFGLAHSLFNKRVF